MTEIERIIKKGIITQDFLKEEVDSDFLVDINRKKIWAIMLDMVYEFDRVCKKHNLTYYLTDGTLLGAVRHKGFIPWDDDFDVAMPRKDYEVFVKLSEEFRPPYFLQTPQTDPEYFYSFAKIRNSNTTGVVEMFEYAKFNHGIWISIFPLDQWDDNGGIERYEQIRALARDCSTYMRRDNPFLSPKDVARVNAYRGNPIQDYEEIQRIASSCKDANSKYMITATLALEPYERKLFKSSAFNSIVTMEFEGLQLMAPSGYDYLLRVLYGDYMQLPPKEERGVWHGGVLFDADISYKDYLKNKGIVV